MSAYIADAVIASRKIPPAPGAIDDKPRDPTIDDKPRDPTTDDVGPRDPTTDDSRRDLTLAALVRQAVTTHTLLAERPIAVEVRHGWVALTGEVANAAEKRLAEAVCKEVADLRGVSNHLIFESDALAWKVGQKIADSFAHEGRLAAQGIMVNVHDHRVILCGTVRSPRERDVAYAACWEVPGVAEVVNRLHLKQ
jgi:osmotically-inducible protein OsmY